MSTFDCFRMHSLSCIPWNIDEIKELFAKHGLEVTDVSFDIKVEIRKCKSVKSAMQLDVGFEYQNIKHTFLRDFTRDNNLMHAKQRQNLLTIIEELKQGEQKQKEQLRKQHDKQIKHLID